MSSVRQASAIQSPSEVLVRRLTGLAALSPQETLLVREGVGALETVPARGEVVMHGEPQRRVRVLVSGWGCRARMLADGRRQILHFLVPGDFLIFQCELGAPAQAGTTVMTDAEISDVTSLIAHIEQNRDRYPGLVSALARIAYLDQGLLLDHLVRLGRQSAYERVAHLLLELQERLEAVGSMEGNQYALPLTQEAMADALGLSIVHMNRTLQQLRRDRLIELRGGTVSLLDPQRMASIADF